MPLEQLTFADEPASLGDALSTLSDLEIVGVDVERADSQRYYRAAALIQVGGSGRVAVVDPLAVPDLAALHEFLAERTVILHAMENDLPPLNTLGVDPDDIEDTAIAAALLGMPVGLESLLQDVLDVALPGDKQAMQRADWEARPLASDMLHYAAADVADLPALWAALAERLRAAERMGWYEEELAAARARPSIEERRDWSKTRGAGRLTAAARSKLRALWETRERLAQETDTAPARVLPDRVLVDLAADPPKAVSELGRRGMRRGSVRQFGSAVIEALSGADAVEVDERRDNRRPSEEERALTDQLRAVRAERAAELGIDPGVLCPNRHLMGTVLTAPATRDDLRDALGLRTWQWEQLGDVFCEALELPGDGKAVHKPDRSTEETTDD